MRRLPPLKALQAFEVAGRHQSLKKAADELHVTTGAISQQIKQLEDHLGIELFKRLNKSVRLTNAGRACLPYLQEGFASLYEAVSKARGFNSEDLITVSVAPSFGAKWLLPRLELFRHVHPDIDLRIDASTRLVDFSHEDVDLAIRYGPTREKGMYVELLTEEEVFPVCSPRLLEKPKYRKIGTHQPEILTHFPLLHLDGRSSDDHFPDWSQWLEAANIANLTLKHGPRFSMSSMVLQAAIDGQGIAMGSSVLAAEDLQAGRLIRLFDQSLTARYSYYLICTKHTSQRPAIVRFIHWLKQEITR